MNVVSCQHIQKESFEALINHQWFIAWYGYCPMKDQFQMHSMWEGTLLQAELLSLSCSINKLCVVEVVVVHFVQLYFVNAYQTNKHPMLLNPFELTVVPLFHSFTIFRQHWIHWTTFESLSLHLLMNFSFWWFLASDELASYELASDDVITSGALCLQEHFDFRSSSLQMLLSFLFVYFFALFCSSRTY